MAGSLNPGRKAFCLSFLLLSAHLLYAGDLDPKWPVDKIITRSFVSKQHQEVTGPHERLPRISEFNQTQTVLLETARRADLKPGRDLQLSFSRIQLNLVQENEPELQLDSKRVQDRVHPALSGWRTIKDVQLVYRRDAAEHEQEPRTTLVRVRGFSQGAPPAQVTDPALYQPFLSPSALPLSPSRSLAVGTRWQQERMVPLPGAGTVQARFGYEVMGTTQTNGFDVLRVAVSGTLTADADSDESGMHFVSGAIKGVIYYSMDWGVDIHQHLTQVMALETPHPLVGGLVKTVSILTHEMNWLGMRDREGLLIKE